MYSLKDLPPYLPKAFIAIEDRRFYSHYGVDPIGIARAAVANVMHRGVSQGGSTLTQQLAKNLFLTQERTMQRKLQEVDAGALAGAQAFQGPRSSNSISTASISAPAPTASKPRRSAISANRRKNVTRRRSGDAGRARSKSPSRLAPNRNSDGAEQRAQIVLAAMADAEFITDAHGEERDRHAALQSSKPAGAGTINYVADWIMDVLDDLVGQVDQDIVVETVDRSEAAERRREVAHR